MGRLGRFLVSVREEMKVVTWPTKVQLRKDIIVVIETTLMFAAYFAVVDFAIKNVLKLFL